MGIRGNMLLSLHIEQNQELADLHTTDEYCSVKDDILLAVEVAVLP